MNKSKKSFILLLVSALFMSLVFTPAYPVQAAESNAVQVWLTDISSDKWLEQQSDVLFETKQTTNPLTINVDASRKYQQMDGFGASLTDSSAWLIWNKLTTANRDILMNNLFNPTTGIGMSLVRTPMGATDVNYGPSYSYNDMPEGQTDPTLENFSIAHDEAYIIPELKQALSLNPSLNILANPHSPPGWMKTSGSMIGGTLLDEYYDELANYFVKYIQAFSAHGVPISYVTPQNEPMGAPEWPGMFLSVYQNIKLTEEMGKAFAANNITAEILGWDHNWDVPSYPETIFNDPDASQYTAGTAWHIYSGSPVLQTLVHNDYPNKKAYITEATGGIWQENKTVGFHDALNWWIIEGTRNWANGVMLWNIALDENMGPLNSDTGGIPMMRGLVTINQSTGEVTYNEDFYAVGHASKFVQPGAYRIYSNSFGDGSIENVAFQNPDGSKVLIVHNSGNDSKTFSVADGTESFDYTLNAGNAVTFTWEEPQQNGAAPAAVSVTDATYDFRFSDSAIITYDPALLDYQNTIRTGNSLITYSLPIGASIQTGEMLDRSQWTVTASSNSGGDGTGNASGDAAVNAIDGDIDTRWTTGHGMKNGDWFQIDLGSSLSFDQIVLDLSTSSSFDYATNYQVYVSDDGVNWGTAIVNAGNGHIGKNTITLPTTQTAQYIRIVSTGASSFWWSIGEINVYSSVEAGSFAAPTAVSNGLELQNWTSPEGEQVTVVFNGTGSSESFAVGAYTYTLPSRTSAMFTTASLSGLPTPAFSNLTPNEGLAGNKLTISGSNFGSKQGFGTVNFGSIPAIIDSWSDSSITAYVPNGLPSGTITVSVNGSSGVFAGESSFNVRTLPPALPRTGWTVTATDVSPWGDVPENMLDGDINSRYSSGTGMYNGLSITVDMGQMQTFNKLMLDSGSSIGDYARSADVYVSTDGTDWTKVSSIVGDGQAVQLASFQTQTARYIKVVNTGSAGNWWSVAEFNIYDTRANWTATATDIVDWDDKPEKMLDGDRDTRYTSGIGQYNGLSFTVDMGQTETFNKIKINSGSGSNDYARSSDVFVSTDGTNWTKVASVTGAGPLQEITFQAQTARYIKVVCTGNEGYWWSVAEFDAYYANPDYRANWTATATDVSPWGDVPGNMLDGNPDTRYSSGTGQYDGLSFTVDMGQTETFNKLVIDSGSGSNDYARSSDIFVSTDGTNWTKVISVTGTGPLQEITFQAQTARYIKVVCTGNEGYWWSIAEFDVYQTAALYEEVYFKHEGEKITSLTVQDSKSTITLEAWGKSKVDGQADVNITSEAAWSVESGQDVASVNNGIITINKDGNASVKIIYDGKEAALSLVINKASSGGSYVPPVSDTGTGTGNGYGEVTGTINNSDGSITNIYGESGRAVTEYSADIISSMIADLIKQNKKELIVTLPYTSASINELVFAADAVKQIADGKIDLKVQLKNTSLIIPSSVLKELSADLKIEIKTLADTEKQNVLTNLNGLKVIGPVIEFTLTSVKGSEQNSVTQFKEKVTVEMGVEGINTSNIDTKKLGVYYLDETSGTWIYVGGKYNSETGMVEAKTRHFTKFAVMEYNKSFSDIGSEHWAKAYIEVIAAKHITTGVSETSFDPAGKVTRAQFATFLVRALGIDLPAYKGTFTDVPEGQWYTAYVEAAQASGIINGVGNDRFDPHKEITREQMAVMVMGAYTYVTGQTANTVGKDVNTGFDDLDQAASWSKDAIKASFKLGIINGVKTTSYAPGLLAQRDQAASIIYRFLKAIGEL
ncbi:discoidin domain-containing protein [Paenibacillus tarimensis]